MNPENMNGVLGSLTRHPYHVVRSVLQIKFAEALLVELFNLGNGICRSVWEFCKNLCSARVLQAGTLRV
jgi:hypothetical protein